MAATKKTVLITGSTRGIGLAFAEYYVNAGWNVIGTARANSTTEQLAALSPFKIVTLDSSDETTMLEATRQLEGVLIDLLINNAGIGTFTTFETAKKDAIMKTLEVNPRDRPANVVALGQHQQQHGGVAQLFRGQYGYTTSKAALNMVTRTMAMDLRDSNVAVVTITPGYVDTDMSNHQCVIKSDDAAAAMANIVAKLSLEDSGKFLNADPAIPASELPW